MQTLTKLQIRYEVVFVLCIFLLLVVSVGCRKEKEELLVDSSREINNDDDINGNNNPGTPYYLNVYKVEPGKKDIAFIITADNHLDCSAYRPSKYNDTDAAKRNRAIASKINYRKNILGVVQLGDMIDGNHTQNLIAFRQIWENDYYGYDGGSIEMTKNNNYTAYSKGHKVKYPVFPTIGNHGLAKDYSKWHQAGTYIRDRVKSAPGILEYFDGSQGTYCWRWGQYFFVQLGLWAGSYDYSNHNTNNEKIIWLKDILKKHVGNSNMGVFIFQHYGWDDFSEHDRWWTGAQRREELNVLCRRDNWNDVGNPYNVIGIFSGHIHTWRHYHVSAGNYSNGNPIKINNYCIPDVGKDDHNNAGYVKISLTENKMHISRYNYHTNTWYNYYQNISTGSSGAKLFWYTVGNKIKTDGHATSWSSVININSGKPFGGGSPSGGGTDISNINSNETPEVVLMGIEHLDGRNQFYYDIYWDVNDFSDLNGRKSRVFVPTANLDIGNQTAGGGVAFANIDDNNIPDIVLMSIAANTNSMNNFRYCIGWDIDNNNGEPSRGWDKLVQVPGSFDIGKETAGAGIALYDIDGNNKLDIVLMAITNNAHANNIRYIIGWNIDLANHGQPSSWSSVVRGPDHLGVNSQGGGLSIADIDNNGRPEFVFLNIDNPDGANGLWYDIAWNIDINGSPTTGGGCNNSPCWTLIHSGREVGYSNNGGGCALYDFDGDGKNELWHTVLDEPFTYY